MDEHVNLKRDGLKPLAFEGKLMAAVSTRNTRQRWTELRLYKSRSKQLWVAQQIARTQVDGELDRYKVWSCDGEASLRECVGSGPLARQLYLEAGLNGVETLDSHGPRAWGENHRRES